MKKIQLACIGAGNMGGAFLKGIIRSQTISPKSIVVSDSNKKKLEELRKEIKIHTTLDNLQAVHHADVVILAVKPQILDLVLTQLKDHLPENILVISLAAGYPTQLIEILLGGQARVIRAMPNIAASVGMAATALCRGRFARNPDFNLAMRLFGSCGIVIPVDEALMDAVTGLSGTGPMYVFIIIEALSDAGVKVGLGREESTKLATQTVLGAARMVEETGRHPIFLKDMVTSPGGTAINALYSMEKTGLRAVIMEAVEVATRRSRELGKPFNPEQDQ